MAPLFSYFKESGFYFEQSHELRKGDSPDSVLGKSPVKQWKLTRWCRVPGNVSSIMDRDRTNFLLITGIFVKKKVSAEEVNNIFREEADIDRYRGIMGVSEDPIVSSDIIKDPRASIVDLEMTKVVDGDLVKVMSWYDNEWGYACQMIR